MEKQQFLSDIPKATVLSCLENPILEILQNVEAVVVKCSEL